MGTPLRVLILEDRESDAELMLHEVRRAGFEVSWDRVDNRESYSAALERVPDVILSDYRLPGFDAMQALAYLRKRGLDIPFIVVSGTLGDELAAACAKNGATDYVLKDRMARLGPAIVQALESRKLREENRHAEDVLRDSEERYRLVTENIADGVFLFDLDGRLVLANRSAERITGYSQEDLRGRSILSLLTREGAEIAHARMEAARDNQDMSPLVELELVQKDGRRVLVELNVAMVMKNGLPVGQLAVARDISERRSLEDQLRQAQKMEGIGQLAGGIAHDFNNLLTAIGGRCYLVLNQLEPDNPLRRDLEIVQGAAQRAARLTHQLLAFSRKQILEPRLLNLNAMVADIEPLLQRLIGEDIEVAMDLGSELGIVKADPGQVEQVLMNLAVNARDAMVQGGRLTLQTADVSLDEAYARVDTGVEPGRYVMLAVGDTGHGMDETTQARIFEPFFTTKEIGKGTGLGLATVYGIVKQSHGHIAVASEPGQGATFKIYLPSVDAPPAPDAPAEAGRVATRGSETVLLVEDDELLRGLAHEILTAMGYSVLDAGSPVSALQVAAEHQTPIHLLLTDVVMPQMNGKQLADRLLVGRPELKVLFMSGYTDSVIVKHGVLEPGVHFLHKPFTPAGLSSRIREVLDS
jgi:two-component system cell cycle sensor histidine kinase/response regulator CckA